MAENDQDPKQRLVVDEDWKAQVEKEKAAARAQQAEPSTETPAGEDRSTGDRDAAAARDQPVAGEPAVGRRASDDADADRPAAGKAEERPEATSVPPASFSVLVSMLFTQAMAALGQMPDPATGEPMVDRSIAKHYIDTLGMLEEKTKGNLSSEEAAMLSEALHALRMTFVSTK